MANINMDDVVALNALIVTAIGLSFAFGRRTREPPGLNLTGPRRSTALDEYKNEKGAESTGRRLPGHVPFGHRASSHRSFSGPQSGEYGAAALKRLEEQQPQSSSERQLNIFFNWNGHTWDAYEVLGVPAGSSREKVVEAFHLHRTKSPDSTAFLQAATDAILKK